MVKEAGQSFLDILKARDSDNTETEVLESPPPSSMSNYNLKRIILNNAKSKPPTLLDPNAMDIVESSNEKTVLRRQISRINKEIKEMEQRNEVSGYLLDLRRTLAGYLKLWLDHEHRTRDLETQDLTDLQKVLTSKLDRLIEIVLNWDKECCATSLQISFKQVISE